jgi:hypothetical protein
MADDERLSGQRIRIECGKEKRSLNHVLNCGELVVHGILQHNFVDDTLLGKCRVPLLARESACQPEVCGRNRGKSRWPARRAGTFLSYHLGQADQAVLGSDVRRFEAHDQDADRVTDAQRFHGHISQDAPCLQSRGHADVA